MMRSGSSSQGVDLLPGEDALAVGAHRVHHPGRRAGGDEHDVGGELLASCRRRARRRPRSRPASRPVPRSTVTPTCSRLRWMSALCAAASSRMRSLTVCACGDGVGDLVALVVLQAHPEVGGGLEVGHVVGGGDERLARHAVGEHGRTADAVPLDDGDRGPELGGDEGGLVATGAAPDDDDGRSRRDHAHHPTTRPRRALAGVRAAGPRAPR